MTAVMVETAPQVVDVPDTADEFVHLFFRVDVATARALGRHVKALCGFTVPARDLDLEITDGPGELLICPICADKAWAGGLS